MISLGGNCAVSYLYSNTIRYLLIGIKCSIYQLNNVLINNLNFENVTIVKFSILSMNNKPTYIIVNKYNITLLMNYMILILMILKIN